MDASLSHRPATAPIAPVAWGLAAVGVATILIVWFFEYVLKYQPCPLCYEQRRAYYVAIPLALLIALFAGKLPRGVVVAGFAVIALAFLANAGLGVYHAGVEWQWWPGPTDCSGPLNSLGTAGGLMGQLQSIRVVRCDEAAWRFLGLSLAGYNVLMSLALAAVAAWGATAARRS